MLFAGVWWNQASRDHPGRQAVFRHMQLFEALPDEDFGVQPGGFRLPIFRPQLLHWQERHEGSGTTIQAFRLHRLNHAGKVSGKSIESIGNSPDRWC